MAQPRWLTALEASAALPANNASLYQLATVDAAGRPRVRTLGPQGFLAPAGHPARALALLMTDARTPKAAEIRANPRVELVRCLPGTHEQFRLAGSARVVAAVSSTYAAEGGAGTEGAGGAWALLDAQGFDWDALRAQVFDRTPDFIRAWYCGPAPGIPLSSLNTDSSRGPPPTSLPKLGAAANDEEARWQREAFERLAVIVVEVDEVDWCELGVKPQRRTRFVLRAGEWEERELAP